MHDPLKAFFLVFSALFPIVDPLSASPIFLALTRNLVHSDRKVLSWRVALNSFVLMADDPDFEDAANGPLTSPGMKGERVCLFR